MTQKQKKAVTKSAKPVKSTAKAKSLPAASKAAPPRSRPRKVEQIVPELHVLSENEVRQRAYSLWESRGRPIGSPEVDWYRAKEQLSPE
jgi:hypothetical protein